ncbi:hypothetical protein BDN70DRAFT_343888 [Pholiota conissans]|uniref:Uncharacterized protein n=1 Tax=Pholiota conissans TaxID=109636 RepID=A0A9P6CPL1_9AGAR|nr:hypothetical protein BDN70DRAFT_343888 [Pholiota conissans]
MLLSNSPTIVQAQYPLTLTPPSYSSRSAPCRPPYTFTSKTRRPHSRELIFRPFFIQPSHASRIIRLERWTALAYPSPPLIHLVGPSALSPTRIIYFINPSITPILQSHCDVFNCNICLSHLPCSLLQQCTYLLTSYLGLRIALQHPSIPILIPAFYTPIHCFRVAELCIIRGPTSFRLRSRHDEIVVIDCTYAHELSTSGLFHLYDIPIRPG